MCGRDDRPLPAVGTKAETGVVAERVQLNAP